MEGSILKIEERGGPHHESFQKLTCYPDPMFQQELAKIVEFSPLTLLQMKENT